MSAIPVKPLDALTSLRFFAALYVLIYHSGGPALTASGRLPAFAVNFFANGYLGVSFFFVLSGFILTYVYAGKLSSLPELANYGWARVARVYPVYMLALLLCLPFSEGWQSAKGIPQFLLLQSWVPIEVFDTDHVTNSNMPAWTLSVELFFYLMFPVLLPALAAMPARMVAAVALALCLVMILLQSPGNSAARVVTFNAMRHIPVPLLRLPEFAYGVCLGLLHRRGAIPASKPALAVLIAVLSVALLTSHSLWVASAAAIASGGIIALTPLCLGRGPVSRLLQSRAMVLLGGASFSLYLLQTPVHWWMQWLFSGPQELIGRLIYAPTLIGTSIVVFLRFEEPMRRALRDRARPSPEATR